MVINNIRLFSALILIALFLRVFNFSHPFFSAEETRIASRGFLISKLGVDEIGRKFPYVFNSLTDYQLPLTTYVTSLGTLFFGKTDLGARLPFFIVGLLLVWLIFRVAKLLSKEKTLPLLSILIVATSPVLIFLSKVPNESIILATLLVWLFYLLINKKINVYLLSVSIILMLLTSKLAFFLVGPFVLYTIFCFRKDLDLKSKLKFSAAGIIFPIIAMCLFLQIPQSQRSLWENNLTLFSDVTTLNGLNKIRGQGLESGLPNVFEAILVNKSFFVIVGFLHWLSHLQPAILFGQFDKLGNLGFINAGAFLKVLIIPAIGGIIFLIRKKEIKLLLLPAVITLPASLVYPQLSLNLVVASLPFIALIISFGFFYLKPIFLKLIIFLIFFELLITLSLVSLQDKQTANLRPIWVNSIVEKTYQLSINNKVLVSDDLVDDISPFIFWRTNFDPKGAFLDIPHPYKYRQTKLGNIELVGASSKLRTCGKDEEVSFISSKRDLERIKDLGEATASAMYSNNKNELVAKLYERGICID